MVNKIPEYFDREGERWSIGKGDWKSHQYDDRMNRIKKRKNKISVMVVINIAVIILILILTVIYY